VPRAAAALATHFPTLDRLESLLREAGFETFEVTHPAEPLVQRELYLDIEGPFNEQVGGGKFCSYSFFLYSLC
jgi:hypothetical protein